MFYEKIYALRGLWNKQLPVFRVEERGWPEPDPYPEDLILWWRKGNEVDGYWFKAEYPPLQIEELGDSAQEAADQVKWWIADARRRARFWRLREIPRRKRRRKRHRRWRTT